MLRIEEGKLMWGRCNLPFMEPTWGRCNLPFMTPVSESQWGNQGGKTGEDGVTLVTWISCMCRKFFLVMWNNQFIVVKKIQFQLYLEFPTDTEI
jgi:hypothetical protein